MQPNVRATLMSLVEEYMSGLVRNAVSVQRHSKRARLHETPDDDRVVVRRRIHASDINMALQLAGSEKLYSTPVVQPDFDDPTKKVNLDEFLRTSGDNMPAAPSEVSLHMNWIAVDGIRPDAPASKSNIDAVPTDDGGEDDQSGLRVNQLQSSLLSEELQLYFSRVTMAMELGGATPANRQKQDAVLLSVSRDPGIQELVPFLVRYCEKQLYKHLSNTEHCRTLIRLALSLLRNPHIHLELHLHELLPALMTCVVAKRLGPNHWALRREAAVALIAACNLFGDEYATLKSRALRALRDAVVPDRTLASQYGGSVAISLFGPRAIDAFLLPIILPNWLEWEGQLNEKLSSVEEEEIKMCQQATLNALTVYFPRVTAEEKAARLEWKHLQEVFGDTLVPIQGDESDYCMCFI